MKTFAKLFSSPSVIGQALVRKETGEMEFLFYMGDVFSPVNFGLLVLGTVGGLILGATPGLSPTMAVALLIPFTFQLEPQQGLILLGAAYTSTVAGGAVSAILLKIPGAPANIATTLDGHKMATKGEGAKALQVSFLASAIGGVFGVLLLIFLTPVLAQWALAFGPSHLFWLAILGVTVIGTLDSSSVVKGLLSGCIGLWLATIGFDDIMGTQRFIFHPAVSGGINVIPALIGLFAIPQVITMFTKGRTKDTAEVITVKKHPIRFAFVEIFKRKTALVIGTLTGSIIGLIPGVGGQIAGLVAYDQSRKFSRESEKFGTGHSEGVIAAESANNAMVGPSLVPLLTLSIPGSPTAAVLLGGLLIHGIFPGPDLFMNYPQVAWTFIDSMLIGQILMCIFGLYIAGLAARVAQVPRAVMASIVLGLALFGSYSVQHSMGDVYVMATLGIAMYFLERFGFSAAPLVLGLILGPIAEANFIQGSMIATATIGVGAYFFTGWLNWLLIFIVTASIGYSIWMEAMMRRYTTKDDAIAKEEALS
jgi:putative tricarboxylic transport membrane protein